MKRSSKQMFCENLLSCYTLTLDFALLPLWFQGLVARGLGDLPRKWDGWNVLHNHMADVSEEKKLCKCCGYSYAEADGRQRGS